jgi:phosphatidylglycerophosphate synthase
VLGGVRSTVRPFARALAAPFLWLRVPPNGVTLLTLVPALGSSYYVARGMWGAALGLGVLASLLDMIDGTLARVTARVTPFGGFLDSVVDRVVDVLFLFGVGFAANSTGAWILVGAGVAGGLGTPYARARAYEALDTIPEGSWQQLFERPERLIVLGLGVLAQWLSDLRGLGTDRSILVYALAIYAVGSLITLAQRVVKVKRLLEARAESRARGRAGRAPSSRTGP